DRVDDRQGGEHGEPPAERERRRRRQVNLSRCSGDVEPEEVRRRFFRRQPAVDNGHPGGGLEPEVPEPRHDQNRNHRQQQPPPMPERDIDRKTDNGQRMPRALIHRTTIRSQPAGCRRASMACRRLSRTAAVSGWLLLSERSQSASVASYVATASSRRPMAWYARARLSLVRSVYGCSRPSSRSQSTSVSSYSTMACRSSPAHSFVWARPCRIHSVDG